MAQHYRLWIDDQANFSDMEDWRSPPSNETDWMVAETSEAAINAIKKFGIPHFIEFDHDLGTLPNGTHDTSMIFLKWLAYEYPEAIDNIKDYKVHSKNPEGTKDIVAFMESWKRSRSM